MVNPNFKYYKSIKFDDFIDVIFEDDNMKSVDIHIDIYNKFLSEESLRKLDKKFDEEELGLCF